MQPGVQLELNGAVARITFVQPDGSRQTVEAAEGCTVMDAARGHNIRGLPGKCGGQCCCSTCHCYVDSGWAGRLPPKNEDESALLEFAHAPRETSRLSCQLRVDSALDGLVLHVPERQL